MLIVTLVVLAAVGGGLYARHAHSGYAGHTPRPASPRTELNLRDEPPQPMTGASQLPPPTSSHPGSTNSSLATPATNAITLPCNQTAAAQARLAYTASITAENSYHALQLSLISATSTVGNLLNPSASSQSLTVETNRDAAVLQAATTTLDRALTAARCE